MQPVVNANMGLNTKYISSLRSASPCHTLSFTTLPVRNQLNKFKVRRASGPDGIRSRPLRSYRDELCGIVEDLFNPSLKLERVPHIWKTVCLLQAWKTLEISTPEDLIQIQHLKDLSCYRLMALSYHLMKTLEQLVLAQLWLLALPALHGMQTVLLFLQCFQCWRTSWRT